MTVKRRQNGSNVAMAVMLVLTGFLLSGAEAARTELEPGFPDSVARTASADSLAVGNVPPDLLTVGRIEYKVANIYSDQELAADRDLLRFVHRTMNSLHTRTRIHVLRREMLLAPGDPLNAELLAETERNLRNLGFLNNVRIVPLDTLPDGTVDLLVHVQDTWSLSTNLSYSRASEGSQRWSVLLSDGTFLGQGIQVGGGLGETEDYPFWQLDFHKRHLLGSPWQLDLFGASLGDGRSAMVRLRRPFYAQDDPWSWDSYVWGDRAVRRYYLSNARQAGGDPGRNSSLYAQFPIRDEGANLTSMWRLNPERLGRIWRMGLGVQIRYLSFEVDEPRLELSDGRPADLDFLTQGHTPVTREQGSKLYPYGMVSSVGRSWTTTRFLLQYGPLEDVPLDPSLQLRIGPELRQGSRPEGTDGRRGLLDFQFSDWSPAAGGFFLLQSSGKAAWGSAGEGTAWATATTAWLGHLGKGEQPWPSRLVAEAGWGDHLLGSEALVLGLNRGLRTLGFDGMAGDRLVRWNVEQGFVLPSELLGFYRGGLAVFYDGGLAWWRGEDRSAGDIRHELGVGIRFGSTRSVRLEMARLDLTWGLGQSGGPVVTAVTHGLF